MALSDFSSQDPEELEAHFGPAGPVAAAAEWLEMVLSGDLGRAWPKTDPALRLVLAQAWLWANRNHPIVAPYDRDEAADGLSGAAFDHDLWPYFEDTQLGEFAENLGDFNGEQWGAASRPRPVPPDYEIVKFLYTGGDVVIFTEPTFVERAIILLLRTTSDGWVVSGFEEDPPEPGWPPKRGFGGY